MNDRNYTWFEEEEVQGCPLFGNNSMDTNNVTALTACCWCGGGDIAMHNNKVGESLRITQRLLKNYYVILKSEYVTCCVTFTYVGTKNHSFIT